MGRFLSFIKPRGALFPTLTDLKALYYTLLLIQIINYLDGNSHLLVKFQTVVISKAPMKGRELFYSLMYCDFKGIVPHSSAQAVAGQRYKCLVYAIYPLTCIFSVCSIFVPTYVGLVGNLINTTIAMVWMPLQAKPKSDHRVTEHSKYLVFLINKT